MTGALLLLLVAAAAAWVAWLRRRWLVVTVSGLSMEPTYADGDRVLARRVGPADLRCDLVIVARVPPPPPGWEPVRAAPAVRGGLGALMIKRVGALPGDPVPARVARALGLGDDARVPAGQVVLLGDNAEHSWDSSGFGYVAVGDVVGAVRRRLTR